MRHDYDAKTSAVLRAVLLVADRGKEFTSDDVRQYFADTYGKVVTGPAIGAAIREAAVREWVRRVGERPSRIHSNHSRRVDVWVTTQAALGDRLSRDVHPWAVFTCASCGLQATEPHWTHTVFGRECPSCGGLAHEEQTPEPAGETP